MYTSPHTSLNDGAVQGKAQQDCLCVQVKMLKELKRDKEDEAAVFEDLKEELLKEYSGHLPVLTAILASDASLPADKRNLQVMPLAAYCALPICVANVGCSTNVGPVGALAGAPSFNAESCIEGRSRSVRDSVRGPDAVLSAVVTQPW